MERKNLEPTLIDGVVADLGGKRTEAFLERCAAVIDFDDLVSKVKDLAPDQPKGGRPFWSLRVMIKCVLLQKWYGLSDPQLEEQLLDRLSFRRFVGLSLADATPDETTLVNFRKRLREAGHAHTLFEAALTQLRTRGLVLKEGTLVDATIVDAPMGHKRADGSHTRDRCATYTKNHGTPRHGYKANLAVSTDRFITDYVFDTAKVHESNHIDRLIEQEPKAVWADSAYMDRERSVALAARGVQGHIIKRRVRGQKELSPEDKARNTAIARVRALVEHPRAWMVKMGYTAVRYRGLIRNGLDFALTAVAYNFKRGLSLLPCP